MPQISMLKNFHQQTKHKSKEPSNREKRKANELKLTAKSKIPVKDEYLYNNITDGIKWNN